MRGRAGQAEDAGRLVVVRRDDSRRQRADDRQQVAESCTPDLDLRLSYTLPANVEALYVNGSGLTGTGSSGADTLITLGANTLVGGDGNDTFVLSAGSAHGAIVADFDHSQADFLLFSGFGTEAQGASFSPSQTGVNQWQILSGIDAHTETITLANGATPDVGDFLFV